MACVNSWRRDYGWSSASDRRRDREEQQMLFDDIIGTDPSPASDIKGSFHFLNRVAKPSWQRVRDLLEDWYAEYPDDNDDLRNRFRESAGTQHYGAWWELYVYTLYRRLGYKVVTHHRTRDHTQAGLLGIRPQFECACRVRCVLLRG